MTAKTDPVRSSSRVPIASARGPASAKPSGTNATLASQSYAVTRESELLAGAERASAYYESASKPGELPPWDFAETAPDAPRDSSAAAAMALGHLVLAHVHPDGTGRRRYEESADRLLATLSRLALNRDPDVDGILQHSCYSVPQGVGVDGATAWGDFYYGLAMAVRHGVVPLGRLLE